MICIFKNPEPFTKRKQNIHETYYYIIMFIYMYIIMCIYMKNIFKFLQPSFFILADVHSLYQEKYAILYEFNYVKHISQIPQ